MIIRTPPTAVSNTDRTYVPLLPIAGGRDVTSGSHTALAGIVSQAPAETYGARAPEPAVGHQVLDARSGKHLVHGTANVPFPVRDGRVQQHGQDTRLRKVTEHL
jgi:hypothetical protein